MKFVIGLSLLSLLFSCQPVEEKSKVDFYPAKKESYQKYVNKKPMPERPDLAEDFHIINNDYPIEISLYEDGKWYYNLENLDDGYGTWKYNEGRLELFAERILFDMHIRIEATAEGAPDVVLKFSDRFGPKTLPTEKINMHSLD